MHIEFWLGSILKHRPWEDHEGD